MVYSSQASPSASPVWTSQRSHSWRAISSPSPGAMICAVSMARGSTLTSSTSAFTRPDAARWSRSASACRRPCGVSPAQPMRPPMTPLKPA